jgi:Zn-dependent protease
MDQANSDSMEDTVQLEATTDNSAAAPASADPPPHRPQRTFYRINLGKITFVELWKSAKAYDAVLSWVIFRLVHTAFPASTDDPAVEHLEQFHVPAATVPDHYRKTLAPLEAELTKLGFHSPIYHDIDDFLHSTGTTLASYAHPTLPVVARVHIRVWAVSTPAKVRLFVEFITAFEDGGYLWTLSSKPDLAAPPACRIAQRTGAPLKDLFELHQQERAKEPLFRKAFSAQTPEMAASICHKLHDEVRAFHVMRGVFVPLSDADQTRAKATQESHRQASAGTVQYPEVMLELDRIQSKKTSWVATLIILVISLAAFLIIGLPGKTSFRFLLALVPVLLFHEAGHYVAMRLCGYRNLRMFFIPGFGAAVSGRAFNVAGWKKVFVALMGPVPGIILGIIVGLCGMAFKTPLAVGAGLLLVAINGFNLAPVLPLDGGQVLQTILFSRHQTLDIVFRTLAAGGLVALSIVLKTKVFMFIAFGMFMSLPYSYKMGQVAKQLRGEQFEPISPDSQSIPPATAAGIIKKLKASNKKPLHNKVLAQQTLQVFETLNTRPPGWLASIGLTTVYLASLAAAVVFAAVFVVAQRGSVSDFMRAAARGPHHSLSAAEVRTSPSTSPTNAASRVTVVATFGKAAEARAAYEKAAADPKRNQSVTLLGDSLFIGLPSDSDAERKHWLADLQSQAKDVFVDGATMRASFRFQAVAPGDEAVRAIEEEVESYLRLPAPDSLIPPWAEGCTLTKEQQLARRTYVRLTSLKTYESSAIVELNKKIQEASRHGDQAEAKALAEQHRNLYDELQRKGMQEVANDTSGAVDVEFAHRYLELKDSLKPSDFYTTMTKELSPRLGMLDPSSAGAALSSKTGYTRHTGLSVQLEYLTFRDPAAGASAIVQWLNSKGCVGLHYEVQGREILPEDDEDPEGP